MVGGKLRIEPKLPKEIIQITYPIIWKGNLLEVVVTKKTLTVSNKGAKSVIFTHWGKEYHVNSNLVIDL